MSNYHNVDDFAPEGEIKREGTIKITDAETGESEVSALYSAADILKYLNRGYDINTVLEILQRGET